MDEPLGLGYGAARRHALESTEEIAPSTFEVGQSSKSLEHEQERAIVTFGALWRPMLTLEAWARQVNAQRAEIWQARYDDHGLIHDILVQHTAMQRELQQMRDRVATLEQERSYREQ
ncbi:hypothetical protein Tco_0936355 [Tanacetum coccineum]